MAWPGTSRYTHLVFPIMVLSAAANANATPPFPDRMSTTRVEYQTATGPVDVSGDRDYSGAGPADATTMVEADNLSIFNSASQFGRRTVVGALDRNEETLITHAFFKTDIYSDFFPGLVNNGQLTFEFTDIHFDRKVTIDRSTALLHKLWDVSQVNALDDFYIQLHNHNTLTNPFRDFDSFLGFIFLTLPQPNFVLADPNVEWTFTGNGTDTITLTVSFPYSVLEHFEENGQLVPAGLPAPQGFLEPFHFHVEYVVVDAFGDADADGDKDLADLAELQVCYQAGMAGDDLCNRLDGEVDNDVDATDVAGIIPRLTGPK